MLTSYRTLYAPQCGLCAAPVTDTDGGDVVVESMLLPTQLRTRLTEDGWKVQAGDARRGGGDPMAGDRLVCPACAARQDKARATRLDALNQPPATEVDMTQRLGPGWTLRQREGDADTHTWLLAQGGLVKGMVRRYRRKSDGNLSGWEAFLIGADGSLTRHSATSAASKSSTSSFLWRSRDLAAWGIAARPDHHTPNPAWSRRS